MFKTEDEFGKHPYGMIFVSGLIFSLIIAFWPVLRQMIEHWNRDDNSYCYLVIPIFLYICWEQRKKSHLDFFSWSWWGVAAAAISILLIIIGELGSAQTLLYVGIWGCIVGLLITLYSSRLKHLIFPIIVLFFIVPIPLSINRMLTFNLKMAATSLSVEMLRLTGISVLQEGNIIDLGISQLQVVDACSGLRYLMPLLLTALLVGYFFNKKIWQRAVLVFMVIPLSIFFNAIRIWVNGVLTVQGYEKLAQSIFHDFSGLLIYLAAGAILIGMANILKKLSKEKKGKIKRKKFAGDAQKLQAGGKGRVADEDMFQTSSETTLKPNNDTGDTDNINDLDAPNHHWLKPTLITAILFLLFTGSGWAIKAMPSTQNLPERKSFDSFPPKIGEWYGQRNYLSKEIMDQLWADDYVSVAFTNRNSPNTIYLFVPFYEYQKTRHTVHPPQSCLLGGGWDIIDSRERLVNLNHTENFKIMTMILQKGSTKLLGSYFFFQRGRVITNPWLNKFYIMWDAFTKNRTDGALVRAEMVVSPGQSMDDAYRILESFVGEVYAILPEYVPL